MTSDGANSSEQDLVNACAGDRGAVDRVIKSVEPSIRKWVLGRLGAHAGHFHAMDEIVQECLFAIAKGLPQLRPPIAWASFRAWVSAIVQNQVARYFRTKARALPIADDLAGAGEALGLAATQTCEISAGRDPGAGPRTKAELAEEFARAMGCLHQLDDSAREAAFLAFVEELLPNEIAERLGIERAAATMRVLRARRKIKECMERR